MKSKTPEKFEKLIPNDYWLLVPWRFYAWHPHHTSRDRSRFLRMILLINNTKNTFYETKVLKTKHVSFLKYIYNALLNSYRTFGPVSLRNLPVAVIRTGTNFDRSLDLRRLRKKDWRSWRWKERKEKTKWSKEVEKLPGKLGRWVPRCQACSITWRGGAHRWINTETAESFARLGKPI